MKRMLISATSQTGTDRQELRMVLIKDGILQAMEVENSQTERRKGNIYVGIIKSIELSLGAVFVDYGFGSQENGRHGRQGFLPVKEIAPQYLKEVSKADEEPPNLKDQLSVGQKVLVQVQKEERGTKGASLTTYVSLPGLYLVLIAKPRSASGVSRRVSDDERFKLREMLSQLVFPDDVGVIARTASLGQSTEVLQNDLDTLIEKLRAIQQAVDEAKTPQLIHKENGLVTLALRNHLTDLDEIIIDDPAIFDASRQYIEKAKPDLLDKIKLYEDTSTPLFVKFQIEHQIEAAYRAEVRLPSGGLIVINHTEALVSIDVNSARATRGKDIEETALNTNLEAAEEIARQLRLRDVGGLIVIDFIDMTPAKNLREVENHLRYAVRADRARVQIGRISSRFGLLEMSRQRLHSSLGASNQTTCPRCSGRGTIQKAETLALSLLRILEEEACQEPLIQLQAQLPVEVATFILNEKRHELQAIEKRQSLSLLIIPNPHLTTPHYQIRKVRRSSGGNAAKEGSHLLIETPDIEINERLLRLDESPTSSAIPPQLSTATSSSRQKGKKPTKKRLLHRIFGALLPKRRKKQSNKRRPTSRSRRYSQRSRSSSSGRRRTSQQQRGNRQRNRPGQGRGRSQQQARKRKSD